MKLPFLKNILISFCILIVVIILLEKVDEEIKLNEIMRSSSDEDSEAN